MFSSVPLAARSPYAPTNVCAWGAGFFRTADNQLLVNDWDLDQWCQLREPPCDAYPNGFIGGDIDRGRFRGQPYAPHCLPEAAVVSPASGVYLIGVTDGNGRLEQSVGSGSSLSPLVDLTDESHLS